MGCSASANVKDDVKRHDEKAVHQAATSQNILENDKSESGNEAFDPNHSKSQSNDRNDDIKVVEAVASYVQEQSAVNDQDDEDHVGETSENCVQLKDAEPMSKDQVAVEMALEELKESVFGLPVEQSSIGSFERPSSGESFAESL